jgi:phosphoribosylformylglycinamidine (FGAM) synthase PurS component
VDASDHVTAWFTERNIEVRSYRVPSAEDKVLDGLAFRLGQNYRCLEKFYQQIKKVSIEQGQKLTFDLSNISEDERQAIRSFCKSQFSNPYWDSRYVSELDQIEVMPIRSPILSNFLQGGWLESFVDQKLRQCLIRYQLEHIGRRGLQITLPNPLQNGQQNCELDIFFLIAGQPLWMECKVGSNYKQDLPRYGQQRAIMGLDKEQSWLVLTNMTPDEASSYTPLGSITLVSIDNLEEKLQQVLQSRGLGESWPSETVLADPVPLVSKNRLSEILNHRYLRPSPDIRSMVLSALVELFARPHSPLDINQIKESLVERIQAANPQASTSKARVSEILRALLFNGGFRDDQGQIISETRFPIAALAGDVTILEQKCIEAYAIAILDTDPRYFESTEHRRNFQEVTGGEAPAPETIQRLLRRGCS